MKRSGFFRSRRGLSGLMGLLLLTQTLAAPAGFEVVATVDRLPITALEYQRALDAERAGVYQQVQQRYGVSDGPSFWTTRLGTGAATPADLLRTVALKRSIFLKLEQRVAQELGVLEQIDEQSFQQAFRRENDTRVQRRAQGLVVYGPVTLTLHQFAEKTQADLRLRAAGVYAKTNAVAQQAVRGSEGNREAPSGAMRGQDRVLEAEQFHRHVEKRSRSARTTVNWTVVYSLDLRR